MNLLDRLEQYKPADEDERISRDMSVQFIHTYRQAFDPTLRYGHITASALLLNQDKTKFLLMRHTKLNKWVQVGGHCDGNRDVLAVALKEAAEESGIPLLEPITKALFDVEVYQVKQTFMEPEHYHYDMRFLLKTVESDTLIKNHEAQELRWFSFDEHLPPLDHALLRLIEKTKAFIGYIPSQQSIDHRETKEAAPRKPFHMSTEMFGVDQEPSA